MNGLSILFWGKAEQNKATIKRLSPKLKKFIEDIKKFQHVSNVCNKVTGADDLHDIANDFADSNEVETAGVWDDDFEIQHILQSEAEDATPINLVVLFPGVPDEDRTILKDWNIPFIELETYE